MGKLYQGILGGISGKVGNVIGSSWKGIPVIKARPLSVANPRSAGQVAQRGKLSNVVAFAKPLLSSVLKPLWDRFAQQQSGYNAFIGENIDLFASSMPSPASDLVVSKGKRGATSILSVAGIDGASTSTISWENDSGVGLKLDSDEAYVVLVNEDLELVKGFAPGNVRSDTSAMVDLDQNFTTGQVLHAYLSFRRTDGTVVSDNSYKEKVVEM